MAEGWIKLSRKIQESAFWDEKPFSKSIAWVDLLLLANYEDKKAFLNGQLVICRRGDVNLSIKELAERWGWSRHKVSDFLNLLEQDMMVTQKRTSKRTVITIVNYDKYQCDDSQKDIKRTSEGHQKDTTKKVKNIKKYIPQNKFNDFQKTEYDFEELERLLNEN